jgi:N-acetylmuramic acid 6-phosphate etherase
MNQITENENPLTRSIDKISTHDAAKLINEEDKKVAEAIEAVIPEIAKTIDCIATVMKDGGRLFYVGTGTSGRLGVLDASELPPTFGVSSELVTGIIAGGYEALYKAVEASEDDREAGAEAIREHDLTANDAVIGVTASGTTQYTIGAVEYASNLRCFTACVTCAPESPITEIVDTAIVTVVGPEVITGSTRMKSGTAQKLILNMISTLVMVKLGYVKGNKMVNVKATNKKLVARSLRILTHESGLSSKAAEILFIEAGDLKTALVMNKAGVNAESARRALAAHGHSIETAIEFLLDT